MAVVIEGDVTQSARGHNVHGGREELSAECFTQQEFFHFRSGQSFHHLRILNILFLKPTLFFFWSFFVEWFQLSNCETSSVTDGQRSWSGPTSIPAESGAPRNVVKQLVC